MSEYKSQFRIGDEMVDEERQDLGRRIDRLTEKQGEMKGILDSLAIFIHANESTMKTCREHCEANKSKVWDSINEIRRFNPVWIYAIGMTILAIIGIINLFVQLKGAHP